MTTENPYGIGIRDEPDIDGPRTGEDLIRGSVFEARASTGSRRCRRWMRWWRWRQMVT